MVTSGHILVNSDPVHYWDTLTRGIVLVCIEDEQDTFLWSPPPK